MRLFGLRTANRCSNLTGDPGEYSPRPRAQKSAREFEKIFALFVPKISGVKNENTVSSARNAMEMHIHQWRNDNATLTFGIINCSVRICDPHDSFAPQNYTRITRGSYETNIQISIYIRSHATERGYFHPTWIRRTIGSRVRALPLSEGRFSPSAVPSVNRLYNATVRGHSPRFLRDRVFSSRRRA